jgi:PAS domain S-box-containing protein
MTELLGYSRDEFLGKKIWNIGVFKDIVKNKAAFTKLQQKKYIRYEDLPLETKDGRHIEVEFVSSVYAVDRKKKLIQCHIRDIPERKREGLLKEKEFSDNIINTAQTIILVLDNKGCIVLFNSYMEKISGYRLEEVKGKDWFETFLPKEIRVSVRELFLRAISDIQTKGNVNAIIAKDGRELQVEWYDKTLKDANGNTVGLLSIGQDITERKKAEKALQKSEETYRLLADHMTDAVWLMDMNLKVTYCSPSTQKLTGYTAEETYQLPLEKHVTPKSFKELVEAFFEEMAKVEANPGYSFVRTLYVEFCRKDGSTFWAEGTFSLVRDESRRPVAVLCEGRDITERKKAEEALRESQTFLNDIIDQSPFAIWISDEKGTLRRLNKTCRDVLHITDEDVVGKYNIFQDNIVEKQGFMPLVKNVFKKGDIAKFTLNYDTSQLETISIRKPISVILDVTIFPIKDANEKITGVVVQHIDVTERKRAEETIRESESRLKEAQRLGSIGSWEFDVEKEKITWSGQTYELYDRDPALGPPTAEEEATYYSQEQVRKLREYARLAIEEGKNFKYDLEANLPSGRHVFYSATMQPVRGANGLVVKLIGTVQDVTERKKAEETLCQSEERYRLLAENASDVIWTTDMDLRTTYISPSVTRMRGFSVEEAMAQSIAEILTPSSLEVATQVFAEEIALEQEGQGNLAAMRTLELEIVCKDGSTIWTEVSVTFIRDAKGKAIGLVGVDRDITERKQAEDELKKQLDELQRWHAATLGRESRILDLKREVNELLGKAGQQPRYPSAETQDKKEK